MHRLKFSHFYFFCLLGLLTACNGVEVFVENREASFEKTYTSFVLVNKELGIEGFTDSELDKQVQLELEAQLIASGLVYDAKQPDLVIRYHSNEDLRQRERVNNMNPYPFWGMRMYDPWLFNPMMGNFQSQVTTTKYVLLQVILDVIDPKQDKYLMTLTGVTEVTQPKSKQKITLKVVEKTANTFLQFNFTQK
ncbi:MAG: DUF4136 domain-containing protein [Bacteroidetes bacterium]|nr:DUF4136 domain-containing protein [Bacteroidota bacterium]